MHQVWTVMKFLAKYRETEVADLHNAFLVNKNILRLQVSMRDASIMAEINTSYDLNEVSSSCCLI